MNKMQILKKEKAFNSKITPLEKQNSTKINKTTT